MNALLLMVAVVSSQQFDLVCSGPSGSDGSLQWSAMDDRLRVDLDAMKWCMGDCKIIRDIADVQPSLLWLEKPSEYEIASEIVHFRVVDRESGEYKYINETRFGRTAAKGHCDRADFSGFPKVKTKF